MRSHGELDQFYIAGSTLIPLDQLQIWLDELPEDKDIVAVRLSVHHGQSGMALLMQAGCKHVSSLNGGLQAWMAQNYPIVKKTL